MYVSGILRLIVIVLPLLHPFIAKRKKTLTAGLASPNGLLHRD